MTGNSKLVSASSLVKEEDLLKIVKKYTLENYQRPLVRGDQLEKALETGKGAPIVLDAGCGVGESSWKLGKKYPNHLVLGVDKSASRVNRANSFKAGLPANVVLLQADLQDVWPLLWNLKKRGEIMVDKQYILYPNPWPKKKAVKRRWYANPALPFILNLSPQIELRSNWKNYLEDFQKVFEHLAGGTSTLQEFLPGEPLTPFEKKYRLSRQKLFQLNLESYGVNHGS